MFEFLEVIMVKFTFLSLTLVFASPQSTLHFCIFQVEAVRWFKVVEKNSTSDTILNKRCNSTQNIYYWVIGRQ